MNNSRNVKLNPFFVFCQKVIPLAFDESLSYYECLCGLYAFLRDEVIPAVNNNADAVTELQSLFNELKNYVDNYFKSVDFQEYVNEKLDEMADDGTLSEIINQQIFNNKVNTYNQDSSMNRIYRMIDDDYDHIGAIHNFDDAIYLSIDDNTNSKIYKLDKSTYEILAYNTLNFVITDICDYNNAILLLDGSNIIKSYDKDSLLYGGNITLEINVKYCELNDTLYYLVTDDNLFKTTSDFITISAYNLEVDCLGIAIKDNEIYALHNNSIILYDGQDIKRIYNQQLIINNGYIKGKSNAICVDNEKFIVGTYKKLIPIRNDYVFSLYEMNLSKNVEEINSLLNYNSARNEFEIYYDSSNTSVNPDGTSENGFSNIYECLEVALNGNYNKGNIMFKNENEVIDDLFISDLYKKCGFYFNSATINGMLIRNSNKIEINDATITDEYLNNETILYIVNSDVVITNTISFVNSKSLDYALITTYKSIVACLSPISAGKILARTGSIVTTRNNSYFDKKELGDRYSRFLPSVCVIDQSDIANGDSKTIPDLQKFTDLDLEINLNGKTTHSTIPIINGTYTLTHTCITSGGAIFLASMEVNINDTTLSITNAKVINTTSGSVATPVYKITAVFGK